MVQKTIRERCPASVTLEFTEAETGYPYLVVPPNRENTPADQPAILQKAFSCSEKAVTSKFGSKPIYLREGGSIPIISDLKTVVGLDSLMIGLFTPHDNLHAPDESFHLGIMETAISAFEDFFVNLVKD